MNQNAGMKVPERWTFKSGEVAAGFDQHVRETLPWYDLVTSAVQLIGRHYIGQRGLVYDIGASTGNIGRALADTLTERKAELIAIEESPHMARLYDGPGDVMVDDALAVDFKPFDLAVCFLVLMFMPVSERAAFIGRLIDRCKPGGAIVIVDKAQAASGYLSTVMWRLTLEGKVRSGIPADQIVAKEISLGGVQRPISPRELGPKAVEFFRFGDFAGWIIEG